MKNPASRLHYFIFIGLLLAHGLVACTDNDPTPEGTRDSGLEYWGTGDGGGGGNICDGRPIEGFVYEVESSLAYKNHIRPILQQFPSEQRGFIYRLLTHGFSSKTKTWYWVPCDLERLRTDEIGAPINTEQAARQSLGEIWISQNTMNAEEKKGSLKMAELLVHEAMMAIELLRYQSPREQCEAFLNDEVYCLNFDDQPIGSADELSNADYERIRRASQGFFKLKAERIDESAIEFLVEHFSILNGNRYLPMSRTTNLSLNKAFGGWLAANHDDFVLTKGLMIENEDQESEESCSLSIDREGLNTYHLSLQTRSHGPFLFSFDDYQPDPAILYYDSKWNELIHSFSRTEIRQESPGSNVKTILYFEIAPMPGYLIEVGMMRFRCEDVKEFNGRLVCKGAQEPADLSFYSCSSQVIF